MTTHKQIERHAVSDEPEGTGAVSTQPARPTGKRSRRPGGRRRRRHLHRRAGSPGARGHRQGQEEDQEGGQEGPRRNPIAYVINYLREVIGELRKVIWPNRKQMVTYTMVVLVFLAFMVTLIGLVDLGVAKLVMMVFG